MTGSTPPPNATQATRDFLSPRFSLPTLKLAGSKLRELTQASSPDCRNGDLVKKVGLVGGRQRGDSLQP